jgi:sedoheptulose-bisphosphatase
MSMFRSVKEIAYKLRSASCDKMACFNLFEDGESQPVDAVANDVIFQNLKACGSVAVASSEEVPTVTALGGKGYAVAFDPLDGDATSAVGSVWGIWPGDKLTGIKGKELKSAGVAVYGPRTTITLALDNLPGSHEFMLMDDYGPMHGQWVKCNEFTNVGEGKLMSPGNLRATQDNAGYKDLFSYYVQNQFALHHTGGLATDATQLLIKGRGVLCHAGSRAAPSSLRVLYEVAPIGFLIEKAGGRSTDGVKRYEHCLSFDAGHSFVRLLTGLSFLLPPYFSVVCWRFPSVRRNKRRSARSARWARCNASNRWWAPSTCKREKHPLFCLSFVFKVCLPRKMP